MRFVGRHEKAGGAARARHRRLHLEGLEDRRVLAGVITIGDSWAYLVAEGAQRVSSPNPVAPGNETPSPLSQWMAVYQPGVPLYNESFGGGTAAQMVAELHTPGGVIARINAHPDADVVWLSAGGNDMLAGQLGGGWWYGNPNNAAVYAAIQANVQAIVDAILAARPDIQIVIAGYDYTNFWDITGDAAGLLRANLGLGKTGFPVFDITQSDALNNGFKAAEAGKIAIANASRRVAHVNSFGLNNTLAGYNGYFGNFGPANPAAYPPELYPILPTPMSRMGGNDPIHLNDTGYSALAANVELNFMLSAFSSPALGLNTTALAFGDRRIGTATQLEVTAANNGANFTKVKNLQFQQAVGAFSGGGQSFQPLFKDPTLGSDTAQVGYVFAPSSHAVASQSISVSSDSGSPSVSLSGRGVGPQFSGPSSLNFLTPVVPPAMPTLDFSIDNATGDGDLGNLTDLTLVSASFSGPAAARFALTNFTPGTLVGAGGSAALQLQFDSTGATAGNYSATLTFVTDQNAAFGSPGQEFSILLEATVPTVASATVTGRRIFYNNSFYDNPGGVNNASAIAPDKSAYIPSGTTPFAPANVTSFSKGINGIMVELTGAPGTVTDADFVVKMSGQNLAANNAPSTWTGAPSFTVTAVPNTPASGTTRYELVWADGAIVNRYVQVTTLANGNTGLAAPDTFYFGNKIGDDFSGFTSTFQTNASDATAARNNQAILVGITNVHDFDKNNFVNATDEVTSRNNQGIMLAVTIGNPPAAPVGDGDGSEAAVAAGLAEEARRGCGVERACWLVVPAALRASNPAEDRVWRQVGAAADPLADELWGARGDELLAADEPADELLGELL